MRLRERQSRNTSAFRLFAARYATEGVQTANSLDINQTPEAANGALPAPAGHRKLIRKDARNIGQHYGAPSHRDAGDDGPSPIWGPCLGTPELVAGV